MPIHKVTKNGKTGYEWGSHGKVYPTREGAAKQARAAYANGYTGDTSRGRVAFEYEVEPETKSVRQDAEFGRLKIKKFRLSKEDINEYKGSELTQCKELNLDPDKTYKLYRPLSELKKAAHTFDMVPITVEHPKELDTPFNEQQREGSTGSDARIEGKYLVNSGKLWGLDAIHGLDTNTRREVSIFSTFDVEMKEGEYEGRPYDGIIRNIVGNSVALTIAGRVGSDVAVGDSIKNVKENKMAENLKGLLKGYGVEDSDLDEISKKIDRLYKSNESEHDTIEDDLDDLKKGEEKELSGHKRIQRELTGRDSDDEWEGDSDDERIDDKIRDRERKRSRELDDIDSDIDDYKERRRGDRDSDEEERRDDRREYDKKKRERDEDDRDSRRDYDKRKRERERDDRDSRRDERRRGMGDSIELITKEAERRGAERAQMEIAATFEAMKLAQRAYGATNFGVGDSATTIYRDIIRTEGLDPKGMSFQVLKNVAEGVIGIKARTNAVGDSRMNAFDELLPSKFRGNK